MHDFEIGKIAEVVTMERLLILPVEAAMPPPLASRSPLGFAVRKGYTEAVQELITAKADVNCQHC